MTSQPYAPPSMPLDNPPAVQAKPRRWWIAGLLGLATIGLGHVYVGRSARGIAGFAAVLALFLLAGALLVWGPAPRLALALFLVPLGLILYLWIEAMVTARRSGVDYRLKWYNRWYVYPVLFYMARATEAGVLMIWSAGFAQSFYIPSANMEPTLLVGDYLYLDKRAYRSREPERGEMVVFISPENPEINVLNRVVGLPGDRLEIRDKQLFINGKRQNEAYAVHNDPVTYSSSSVSEQGRQRDQASVVMPPGQYFLMGDNRDASYDSRFFGPVPRESIVGGGRIVLYWSRVPETGPVRWDRIGRVLDP